MVSKFCDQCGAPVDAGTNFCEQCGAALLIQPAPENSVAEQQLQSPAQVVTREAGQGKRQGTPSSEPITWEQEISLLTDLLTLRDVGIVLTIGLVSLQVILVIGSIIIGERPVFLPGHVYLILGSIFAGLSLLAVLVLRHYTMRYAISSREISFAMGQRERKINRVLGLLALLTGKPQAIGLALATAAGEMGSIPWHEVYKVAVHRGLRVITVSDSWRPVVRLYCPPERFEEIAARVEAYAAEGAAWRASRNVERPRAGFILKWIGLVTLALMASMVWFRERLAFSDMWGWEFGWASNEVPPLVLIVATLVLLAGAFEAWLRRVVALLAIVGSSYLVYKVASLGMRTFTNPQGLPFHGYQAESVAFVVSLAGVLALLVMSSLRLLGYPQGRRWPSQKAKINQGRSTI